MRADPLRSHVCDESALLFNCSDETLVGVLARPQAPREPSSLGVLIIVGGPQYRAGSHRQFVSLARTLAGAGHAVLRFDYRGMGDSSGAARDFLGVDEDIAAAIDALRVAVPTVDRVALWGLCDAASAALLYVQQTRDARVERLVLLNPWVRSPQGLARVQVKHYYRERLLDPTFWAKLLSGRVARSAITELARSVKTLFAIPAQPVGSAAPTPFPARMAEGWNGFDGGILLLLSGNDYTAKEFLELAASDADWQRALSQPSLVREDVAGADHTLSETSHTHMMEQRVAAWLTAELEPAKMAAPPGVAPAPLG